MKTYVYVISGDHGRQKIGSSDNPQQRILDLQTGSPYKLRFEFVGETEDGGGGAVEVKAQFMLHEHKAPGGDEWFVVPPDVAITAVMAAAHQVGYRLTPVDIKAVTEKRYQFGRVRTPPAWVTLFTLPLLAAFAWHAIKRLESGAPGSEGTILIEAPIVFGFVWLVQWFAVRTFGPLFGYETWPEVIRRL